MHKFIKLNFSPLFLDIPKPPPVNKRMPMSFKPTRSPISGLSLECRQAVKAFFVQQSEDSKDHSKCIKAVEGRRKPKRGITVQNVVIVIFFSTIIASASGVASYVLDDSLCFRDAVQSEAR